MASLKKTAGNITNP